METAWLAPSIDRTSHVRYVSGRASTSKSSGNAGVMNVSRTCTWAFSKS